MSGRLSADIPHAHHYERPAKCLSCPFYKQDENCHRGVDELLADVRYTLKDGREVTVKAGFCTDGASIPQSVWNIVGHPFAPDVLPAALVHDALYHSHLVSRAEADALLMELLEDEGVSWAKRHAMYRAVRIFGAFTWPHPENILEHSKRFIELT